MENTIEQQQQAELTRLFGGMMESIARGEDITTPEARARITGQLDTISRGYDVAKGELGERMALKGREMTPGMQAKLTTQKLTGLTSARTGLERGERETTMQGMSTVGGYLQGLQRYNTKLAEMEASAAYQKIMIREQKKQREYGLWTSLFTGASGIMAAGTGAGWFKGKKEDDSYKNDSGIINWE